VGKIRGRDDALREARREEFLAGAPKFGMDLGILSGQEEARLSYAAVARNPSLEGHQDVICVVDIGGGSSELIFGKEGRPESCESLSLGAVRLTEQILKSDPP
jgi:exopolyphosphatase/guanosine-5'-triphosphate,3'-diphosphate pyrophosphatase